MLPYTKAKMPAFYQKIVKDQMFLRVQAESQSYH